MHLQYTGSSGLYRPCVVKQQQIGDVNDHFGIVDNFYFKIGSIYNEWILGFPEI